MYTLVAARISGGSSGEIEMHHDYHEPNEIKLMAS
jgi:hypothetical protein